MKTNSFIIIILLLVFSINTSIGQVSVLGNSGLSTDYVGWNNTQNFPLQIRHNANQPINIFTNNLIRATFTTGNAFGSGSTAGDGLRILDPIEQA